MKLTLEDGTQYPLEGTLQFRDVSVDPTTASAILRMVFRNPRCLLLPKIFVRAIITEGIKEDAILVPQQGVNRTPKGLPYLLLVNKEGKVERRMLEVDRAIGDKWLVTFGLSPGDRVIGEGLQFVRPGMPVKAVAFNSEKRRGRASNRATEAAGRRCLMLSRFFRDRPVFAWVIAIAIMSTGALAIRFLPVSRYPDLAPPTIMVRPIIPGRRRRRWRTPLRRSLKTR